MLQLQRLYAARAEHPVAWEMRRPMTQYLCGRTLLQTGITTTPSLVCAPSIPTSRPVLSGQVADGSRHRRPSSSFHS